MVGLSWAWWVSQDWEFGGGQLVTSSRLWLSQSGPGDLGGPVPLAQPDPDRPRCPPSAGLIKVLLYMAFMTIMIKVHTFPLFAIRPMYLAMR